ncbi:MAG TPA: hypothetical protein VM261_18460 [Kofleriaceae bacterium]|nr:hypothetical protein [Kofleriaceae bacterium]
MMRSILLAITVAAAASACGGKSKPATSTDISQSQPAGNPGEEHEHSFPAEMGAFHDKLAPLWHADSNQARIDQTCTATGELDALAAGVKNGAVPEGVDPAKYSERADALTASIVKLSAACGSPDRATFDADFGGVHSAFHALIELLPATEEHMAPNAGASDLGVAPEDGK